MNKKKTKLITILLASALGVSATVGGALFGSGVLSAADETQTTYLAGDIFVGKEAQVDATSTVTKFRFTDSGTVTYNKRSVALTWKEDATTTKYFSTKFTLTDANFTTLALTMETGAATATKDEKAVNQLVFNNDNGTIKVTVNDQTVANSTVTVELNQPITVSFTKDGADYGEYTVKVEQGSVVSPVGVFTNIGANYAQYVAGSISPLYFEATLPENGEDCVVQFEELNGQSFALTDGELVDNAKPVLVVNNQINSFQLGATFPTDVQAVDVLDRLVTVSKKFYQFNPETAESEIEYHTLTNNTTFMETSYGDGKTVYGEYGAEYVSIQYHLEDEVWKGETARAEYELVWYADAAYTPNDVNGAPSTISYILLDKNQEGPTYTFLTANHTTKENNLVDKQAEIDNYQALITEAATDLFVGTNSYIYLPSLVGLIEDNDGYQNLEFSVSYARQNLENKSSVTGLAYDELKFSVTDVGMYEFKIFANDPADNQMKYYIDGQLEELTTNNVWDIDEIPSFTFYVQPTEMKIEEDSISSRKTTKVLDTTYTLDDINVLGLTGTASEEYGLYRVNVAAFNLAMGQNYLQLNDLYNVTYEELADKAQGRTGGLAKDEEITFFLTIYAECLVDEINNAAVTVADLLDVDNGLFTKIEEYDSRIDETAHAEEWAKNNKYNWKPSSQSFTTAEEGTYVMLASYTSPDVSALKAAAYRVIIAEDEVDVLEGESDWLERNLASVILFSIGGVMGIIIIILLLIKPSDETLEEVDATNEKSARKKRDKK